MGKFVASAFAGATGFALFVGCGGTDASVGQAANADASASEAAAVTGATWDGSGPDLDVTPNDAAIDADGATGPDAGIPDAEADAPDAASIVDASDGSASTTLELPARLIIETDGSMCWSSGAELGTVCKSVPNTTPPIIRIGDSCGTPTSWPIVHTRVPQGSCAKITGQWSGACVQNPSEPKTRCATATNQLDHDTESGQLYKRIVIEWRAGAVCECPP